LGRKLGYPTANLDIENPIKLIPAPGVYAVFARLEAEKTWNAAMVNIGTRPTVEGTSGKEQIEVHLLNGGRQCYNELIDLRFMKRMRDEVQFDGLIALKRQLQQDEVNVRSYLETVEFPFDSI
jgi:riboflavin kinase/FMN adenylyltransferase